MIEAWLTLVFTAALKPTLTLSGVRKIVDDLSWELTWDQLLSCPIGYKDICYTKAKGAQLTRNYWNEEEVAAAFDKLLARRGKDHTSVSIQMRGRDKDSRSQGFCMQNVVITALKEGQTTMTIYYRSTELIQKFLADLIFFHARWPEEFRSRGLPEPSVIRFKFANAYISSMFMPIYARFSEDPVILFEYLQDRDNKFFRLCGLTTRRFLMPTHNYTYKTRVKMFNYWKEHVPKKKSAGLAKLLNQLKGDVPQEEEDDE